MEPSKQTNNSKDTSIEDRVLEEMAEELVTSLNES